MNKKSMMFTAFGQCVYHIKESIHARKSNRKITSRKCNLNYILFTFKAYKKWTETVQHMNTGYGKQ